MFLEVSELDKGGSYSVTMWFDGCSRFGGPVESIDPLSSTSTTVAGVGDCAAEDVAASEFLRRLEGASIRPGAADELVIVGETLDLVASKG